MSTCRLCLKDRDLCRSHILPEFLYGPLYDKKHSCRFFSVSPDTRTQEIRKGLREELLCKECERLLSRYESYGREVLFGGGKLKAIRGNIFLGLDYRRLKLFQLSILWRASIARHPFFRQVELGQHEEKLRNMILSESPGGETEYLCILIGLVHEGKPVQGLILEPEKGQYLSHPCHRFIFGGAKWLYFVSAQGLPNAVRQWILREDGTLLRIVERLEDQEFIDQIDWKPVR